MENILPMTVRIPGVSGATACRPEFHLCWDRASFHPILIFWLKICQDLTHITAWRKKRDYKVKETINNFINYLLLSELFVYCLYLHLFCFWFGLNFFLNIFLQYFIFLDTNSQHFNFLTPIRNILISY